MKREQRAWAREVFKIFRPFAEPGSFERWLEHVEQIEVELLPGGRARLHVRPGSEDESWQEVEIRFDSEYLATSFHVDAPPGERLPWAEVSMSVFIAALGLKLDSVGEVPRGRVLRPSAGKAPNLPFYRRLNAEYDELVKQAHASPISELADRYGVSPGTVKSWRHRGSKYMKRGV